jgi:hypothetical protein
MSHLIACEVFRDEIEAVAPSDLPRTYLEQGLHTTPGKMPGAIQQAIDALPAGTGEILLGYGLCSNGVVGVVSRTDPLVIPLVHDCIALLLGSRERYAAETAACVGTYYITPGWVKYGETVLSAYRGEYMGKYGEEVALSLAKEMLASYKRVALIDHGLGDMDLARDHAREFGRLFDLRYEEIPGSLDYLRRLVQGPRDGADFIRLEPGRAIEAAPFLVVPGNGSP